MQISAANLLIASQQGKPAPKPEPAQSFSHALEGSEKKEKTPDDFAPLSFKTVEKPASDLAPVAQKPATPYGAPATLGSQLNITV